MVFLMDGRGIRNPWNSIDEYRASLCDPAGAIRINRMRFSMKKPIAEQTEVNRGPHLVPTEKALEVGRCASLF